MFIEIAICGWWNYKENLEFEKNPGQWHKLCLLYDHRIKLPQTEESHTHTDKRSTQKPN